MSRSRRVAFARLVTLAPQLCAVGAVAVALAGCASKQGAEQPSRIAGPVVSADDRHWRVEVEEDGLPAQLAPKRPSSAPDDPREPWSPNYGTRSAKRDAAGVMPVAAEPIPDAEPARRYEPVPQPRRAEPAEQPRAVPASARTALFDEEALIRRAIAEHEMRRRD